MCRPLIIALFVTIIFGIEILASAKVEQTIGSQCHNLSSRFASESTNYLSKFSLQCIRIATRNSLRALFPLLTECEMCLAIFFMVSIKYFYFQLTLYGILTDWIFRALSSFVFDEKSVFQIPAF